MECPSIPIIGSIEFNTQLRQKFAHKRIPYGGGWELTLRCNLRCEHCYAIYDTPRNFLSFDEIRRIASELADEGTLGLFLTGGEIMTRRDFPDIYLHLKRNGFLLTLFTNATHVTDEMARILKEYPPFNIEVSIYGATEETYEKMTRVRGSYRRFTEGIEKIRRSGAKFMIKTVATRTNHHEFDEMWRLADRLGVKFRWDASVTARMTGDPAPCALRLNAAEIVRLDAKYRDSGKNWLKFFRGTRGYHSPDREELFVCGAGLNTFFIGAQGKLYPCLMVREADAYDLRTGTFHEGFHHHLAGFRQRRKTAEKGCDRCEIKPLCDGCPGFSLWEHNDLETPVEYTCEISHERYRTFVEPHLSEEERPRIHKTWYKGKLSSVYPGGSHGKQEKEVRDPRNPEDPHGVGGRSQL